MSTYITLSHLQVQNANCISGLTYGFPAITHFMGYVHALSRKLQKSHQLSLEGCAVVCHQHQVHAYRTKEYSEFVFSQTRNPLTRTGAVAPIMEEGKMHLTVSLVTQCHGTIKGGDEGVAILEKELGQLCLTQKLAGGVINQLKSVHVDSFGAADQQRAFTARMSRRLLPGFALVDQSAYLEKHNLQRQQADPDSDLFDAWLDFASLRYKSEPALEKDEILSDKTKATWERISKPENGYLVPIMTGYKAISPLSETGEVADTRDPATPFRFVEAAYGVGEWRSPHRLKNIEEAFWFYQQKDDWYLCENTSSLEETEEDDDDSFDFPY